MAATPRLMHRLKVEKTASCFSFEYGDFSSMPIVSQTKLKFRAYCKHWVRFRRVLVKTGLTRHDGRKWIWVAPELWAPLTGIGPVCCPTCPTCCCRKKWNWDPNKFSMAMCYFELYIQLKKTIKLGESPLYNKMYTFSQKMWQSKCVKMLHDPLFTHFLTWRSRIGGQSLIFWESKRALALHDILCFPASVFYLQASNSLRYVFEAGTRHCAQGSRNLGN